MKTPYLLLRAAAWPGLPRRNRRRAAFDPAHVQRIWVHKPDHLGDALLARPALFALHAAFPRAELRVACDPAAAPLLALDRIAAPEPWASPFLGGDGRLRDYRRRVRAWAPDLIVNLRHDVRDILLCARLGAPYLATYDHRGLAASATHPAPPPLPDRPEADNHLALLAATLSVSPLTPPPLTPPDDARRTAEQAWREFERDGPRIVLHAAARTPAKTWPLAHWRTLIELLAASGAPRLALIGERSDSEINREIARGLPHVSDWTGRFDLPETAAIIQAAELFVGVDSGPGHLAHAVGAPLVSIMSGANDTRRWAPASSRALSFLVTCAPCSREMCPVAGHPCLRNIEPDRVARAAAEVLGA
jgi:ADP-heptose:LPS heptosyltransferase